LGEVSAVSPVYETGPVGMEPGAGYFLNLALCFRSALSPGALLDKIKRFEKQMGRDLANSHNRPRAIDVDILLMEDGGPGIVDTETLTIPHKEMCNRAFVLVPLNDIAPDAVHPIRGKRIAQLLAGLDAAESVRPVKK
jgi:2-amino-4-hydroxy-6-hydroxymethyldihydropteridine diphosphokinase